MARTKTFRTTPATFTFTLILNCGCQVDQMEYVGVDPEETWVPGMTRWCSLHDGNRIVTAVVDPTFNPTAGR